MEKNLSVIASKAMKIMRSENCAFLDLATYHAPSECGTIIHQSAVKEMRQLFNNSYPEAKAFIAECVARTNAKFVYFIGLDNIIDYFSEYQTDFEL